MSYGITLRTHDGHHIFDADNEEKRINSPKDVIVGDKVWMGHYNVALLPGTDLGNGSILGYGSCERHLRFGENKLIAGCPARVLRDNIIWSRDNTGWFDRNSIDECLDQSALGYYEKIKEN